MCGATEWALTMYLFILENHILPLYLLLVQDKEGVAYLCRAAALWWVCNSRWGWEWSGSGLESAHWGTLWVTSLPHLRGTLNWRLVRLLGTNLLG